MLTVGLSVWQPPLANKPSDDWLLVASAERVEPFLFVRPSCRWGALAGRQRCRLAGTATAVRELLFVIHNFASLGSVMG